MRLNGLNLKNQNGINIVREGNRNVSYPVGDLLCRIFQGETLDSISRIVKNCIINCPMKDNVLSQDEIEEAERYILAALLYDDFIPAQRLAQGSFIRCMENYRSLDSNTAIKFLQQEMLKVGEEDELFSDIGFSTVGEYLRLCFNNYYIDLSNGINLFTATSAIWSNTATTEEMALYAELCAALGNTEIVPEISIRTTYNAPTKSFEHIYVINSFLSMAVFEFSHIAESTTKVMRCQNPECRKFFTAKRSSAKYCSSPAPQCPSRTCNDYYPQIIYRGKVRTNNLDKLIKNAKGRLYNARRRHPELTGYIDGQLSDLTIYAPVKKQEVLNGTLSITEFQEWLNSHKKEE